MGRSTIARACEHCGTGFQARLDKVKVGHGRYCSAKCQRAACAPPPRTGQDGENNPNWKGGVSADNMRYRNRQKERYPEKEAARQAVAEAVRRGELVRQPCESCDGTDHIEAHHDYYERPLEVRWLCRRCHRNLHGPQFAPITKEDRAVRRAYIAGLQPSGNAG
jgi:ribosomal protein L37AE/L43A